MAERPSGFTSVMAQRAPVDETTLDYFPTPPWAARAGAEMVRALDPGCASVWEPACGGGHMALPLAETLPGVSVSDIHDHGGLCSPLCAERGQLGDFLDPDFRPDYRPDWIVTNPPFARGAAFAQAGLRRARRGVALLLRTAFVESAGRYPLIAGLALHAPFSERAPMVKGRWDPRAASATAYSWFFWLTPEGEACSPFSAALAAARVHGAHLERVIPPGTRERLSRPDDAARFGVGPDSATGALFGEAQS